MRGSRITFKFPPGLVGRDPARRATLIRRLTLAARERHPDAVEISARACATSRALSVQVDMPGLDRWALMQELTLVLVGDRIAHRLNAE